MNSEEILSMLDQQQIDYQVVNHPAVYTAEEADKYTADYHFARAKNLFLHDKHHLLLCDVKRLSYLSYGRSPIVKSEKLIKIFAHL